MSTLDAHSSLHTNPTGGKEGLLPRRMLGRTGMEVSALGLGVAWLGSQETSDDGAVETVRIAIDAGVNFIDTAPLYGESERRLGRALEDGFRERVVLSTKTGINLQGRFDYSGSGTRRSVENSLKLLGTDRLDVVLIHDPPDFKSAIAPGAALDTLEQLREEGLLRWIGMGVRAHDLLLQAVDCGRFDLILTYMDFTILNRTAAARLIPLAWEKGVAVLNGSPLAMGLLSGADPIALVAKGGRRWSPIEIERAVRVRLWALERGIYLPALALQFSMADPRISVTLNGAGGADEMRRSLDGIRAPFDPGIWDELERILQIDGGGG